MYIYITLTTRVLLVNRNLIRKTSNCEQPSRLTYKHHFSTLNLYSLEEIWRSFATESSAFVVIEFGGAPNFLRRLLYQRTHKYRFQYSKTWEDPIILWAINSIVHIVTVVPLRKKRIWISPKYLPIGLCGMVFAKGPICSFHHRQRPL